MKRFPIPPFECLRCGYSWQGRKLTPDGSSLAKPCNCPRCKSPYWDKPRRKEKKGGVSK